MKIRTIGVGAPTLFVKLARRLLHHLLLHLRLFVIPSSKSDRLLLALLQLILAASTPLHLRPLGWGSFTCMGWYSNPLAVSIIPSFLNSSASTSSNSQRDATLRRSSLLRPLLVGRA